MVLVSPNSESETSIMGQGTWKERVADGDSQSRWCKPYLLHVNGLICAKLIQWRRRTRRSRLQLQGPSRCSEFRLRPLPLISGKHQVQLVPENEWAFASFCVGFTLDKAATFVWWEESTANGRESDLGSDRTQARIQRAIGKG